MSQTLIAPAFGAAAMSARASRIPDELRIPAPPSTFRWIPASAAEPRWRQAMRWSLIGLSASLVAGEVALRLAGL
ncbi:hypothetical protein [Falsiroseomonas oryzae]|uniref:hypothetical protein n=1 Tax=Falsiroseomonas oryzae TaxID=2766473 RepID=UPI0022EB5FDB|nr:hypothetical protein [Roseomonas sp. MO-31]